MDESYLGTVLTYAYEDIYILQIWVSQILLLSHLGKGTAGRLFNPCNIS
jgi:hypothetical protein